MKKKVFIAYFDYLGFKQFIENNNLKKQKQVMSFNFREMDAAHAEEEIDIERSIYDISNLKIKCINFSDTVAFFTKNAHKTSLIEILKVVYIFNRRSINYCFPVRGALVYGEMVYVPFKQENSVGGLLNINSVYGKGLVNAHKISNAQDWAGTVLDESFINEIIKRKYNLDEFLSLYAKKYKVPYKKGVKIAEEYVLNLTGNTLNNEAFKNYSKSIRKNFAQYKKLKGLDTEENVKAQEKISNTLNFLKTYYEEENKE